MTMTDEQLQKHGAEISAAVDAILDTVNKHETGIIALILALRAIEENAAKKGGQFAETLMMSKAIADRTTLVKVEVGENGAQ